MWCVLVCDDNQMAGDVTVVGSYRAEARASVVANQINRKIKIHCWANGWPTDDGEPRAWVQEMRAKVTEVYDDLGIRRLR